MKNIVTVIIITSVLMALCSCERSASVKISDREKNEFYENSKYNDDNEYNASEYNENESEDEFDRSDNANEPEVEDEFYEYTSTEDEGDTPLFDTDREVYILFAGNSLLKTPKTYDYFDKLVERYRLPVFAERELWDGMNVRYQVTLADSKYAYAGEEYAKADIVIIQEYGGHYETTYADICELIEKHCKEDVIVYYYTTEWDEYFKYIKEMDEDERIHILDFGRVQERLNGIALDDEDKKNAYSEFINQGVKESGETEEDMRGYLEGIYEEEDMSMYEYLHLTNDYHPNELNGFLAAAYIYTQLYKTEFRDYGYDELSDNLKKLLPGETDERKEMYYEKMIDIINEGGRQ